MQFKLFEERMSLKIIPNSIRKKIQLPSKNVVEKKLLEPQVASIHSPTMQLTKSGLNVPNDNKVASKDSWTWLVVTTYFSVYCFLVYHIAPFFDICLLFPCFCHIYFLYWSQPITFNKYCYFETNSSLWYH